MAFIIISNTCSAENTVRARKITNKGTVIAQIKFHHVQVIN